MNVPNLTASFETAPAIILEEFQKNTARPSVFKQIEIPVQPLDLISWLASRTEVPKLYWATRSGQSETAGIGIAYEICLETTSNEEVLKAVSSFQQEADGISCFVAIAFDSLNGTDKTWNGFGCARIIVPRVEIRRKENRFTLAFTFTRDEADNGSMLKLVNKYFPNRENHKDTGLPPPNPPLTYAHEPDFPAWCQGVKKSLDLIRQGVLKKIVLARKTTLRFSEDLEPLDVFRQFAFTTPRCFKFYLQQTPSSAFFAASPERLYKRRHRFIQTEALAGTRPRHSHRKEDQALRRELIQDAKEQYEHAVVVEMIQSRLAALCESLRVDRDPQLMRLPGCQHLYTRFSGLLHEGIKDTEVLAALHPTPAVGGFPANEAIKQIRSMEPFSRGFYAGPVGMLSQEESEFAVGIRSAVIQGDQLHLFAGAGIVEGSKPEQEWLELDTKLSTYSNLFEQIHARFEKP